MEGEVGDATELGEMRGGEEEEGEDDCGGLKLTRGGGDGEQYGGGFVVVFDRDRLLVGEGEGGVERSRGSRGGFLEEFEDDVDIERVRDREGQIEREEGDGGTSRK